MRLSLAVCETHRCWLWDTLLTTTRYTLQYHDRPLTTTTHIQQSQSTSSSTTAWQTTHKHLQGVINYCELPSTTVRHHQRLWGTINDCKLSSAAVRHHQRWWGTINDCIAPSAIARHLTIDYVACCQILRGHPRRLRRISACNRAADLTSYLGTPGLLLSATITTLNFPHHL
jgi:hypothetical protein